MKNFKISILTIISSCVFLTSCFDYPKSPTKWVVVSIERNPSNNKTSAYLVKPIDRTLDMSIESTWFVDSVGKFNAGDILSFQRIKE